MNKNAIRKAVTRRVDEKIRKAIDTEAESLARQKVWEAMNPPSKFIDAPTQPAPEPAGPPSKSRVFSPSDPKICGG